MSSPRRRAFSLIELLVVVAIISILAAIAVPNFLESQMRAKVARVKADMRTLSLAVEAYRTDGNHYPYRRNTTASETRLPQVPESKNRIEQMKVLTTPISYISTLLPDLFEKNIPPPNNLIDFYDPYQAGWFLSFGPREHRGDPPPYNEQNSGWIILSVGPDSYLHCTYPRTEGWPEPPGDEGENDRGKVYRPYDPTNGTTSLGNIFLTQLGGLDDQGWIERVHPLPNF